MVYEAVAMYADADSSTIDKYQLPYGAIFIGDDEIDADNGIQYTRTPTSKWTKVEFEEGDDEGGRTIDPIEWTGEKGEPVNITDEERSVLRRFLNGFFLDLVLMIVRLHIPLASCKDEELHDKESS